MTIAESLTKLSTDIEAAYSAIGAKGGTVPEEKNTDNLATAIGTITGGGGVRPPLPEYPYPIDEEEMADGGQYGKVAYLRDDTVHYYTATSAGDLRINNSATNTNFYVKTLEDGFVINNSNLLGWSIGSTTTSLPNYTLAHCPLLQWINLSGGISLTAINNYFCYGNPNLNSPIEVPSKVTSIGNDFMYQCEAYNQPLALPDTLTTIGDGFLRFCSSFNQLLSMPTHLTTIGSSFLASCTSFNQPLSFWDGLKTVGAAFMYGCKVFASSLVLPDTVTSLGYNSSTTGANGFLSECVLFNSPLAVPASVTEIYPGFLYGCTSFNSPLTFRGDAIKSIGVYFMQGCHSFNQPLSLPGNLTTIGGGFMMNCRVFNQPLSFPSSLTNLGYHASVGGVLNNGYAFNQPIAIPASVSILGSRFLSGCSSFNSPVTFEESPTNAPIAIPVSMLHGCTLFNQPIHFTRPLNSNAISGGELANFLRNCSEFNSEITFSESSTTLKVTLGYGFMSGCANFNQPLTLPTYFNEISPGTTSLGVVSGFMYGCTSFNSKLTLPPISSLPAYILYGANWGEIVYPSTLSSVGAYAFALGSGTKIVVPESVTTVGDYFAYSANNLEEVEVNTTSTLTATNYKLSTTSPTAPAYVNGISLTGPGAQVWKDALPDRTSSPFRKLVVAEEAETA